MNSPFTFYRGAALNWAADLAATHASGLRVKWIVLGVALIVPALALCARAQIDQVLPEIDVYHKLSSDLRFSFQAKETREGGAPTQTEIGPSLVLSETASQLEKVTWFDLDDSKKRVLVLSIDYRYLPSPNSPPVNRVEPVATFHFPLMAGFLLSDRNRADLDWQSGKFTWRYRNLIQIEKRLTVRSYHPAPYAAVEFFYQSQYSKWSDTAIYAGCMFPIGAL